mgnify:FL=1
MIGSGIVNHSNTNLVINGCPPDLSTTVDLANPKSLYKCKTNNIDRLSQNKGNREIQI